MKFKDTLEKFLNKKNLMILLIVGVVLMILPDFFEKNEYEQGQPKQKQERIDERALEKILSKLDGVDDVEVLITYGDNGNTNYAYDISSGKDRQELKIKMNKDSPVIVNTESPKISGILVIVKGKNLNEFDLSGIVKRATGVPLHRICVAISEGE